jgi:hypothetical protein
MPLTLGKALMFYCILSRLVVSHPRHESLHQKRKHMVSPNLQNRRNVLVAHIFCLSFFQSTLRRPT